MDDGRPIADAIEGVAVPSSLHPLIGHQSATDSMARQFRSGRVHHALLLTGPKGIGKATLAFHMAAHFLRYGGTEAEIATSEFSSEAINDTVSAQIIAGSHPNLLHLTRRWDTARKQFKTQLTVDEIRQTLRFFNASRGEQGWRVAIIDAVDDMNRNASNALLKILEEPPEKTIFFLLAHSNARILPTIRSRCQRLNLNALADDEIIHVLQQLNLAGNLDVAERDILMRLSKGSVRNAIKLIHLDGLSIYNEFQQVCTLLDQGNWAKIHKLIDTVTRRGKEDVYSLLMEFIETRIADQATGKSNPTASITVLARWAGVWEKAVESIRLAEAYNLDKKQVMLNLFKAMDEATQS
ncbi:MAG: DNA polymerase III subunit delta' [Pseudomonadota bacterium]